MYIHTSCRADGATDLLLIHILRQYGSGKRWSTMYSTDCTRTCDPRGPSHKFCRQGSACHTALDSPVAFSPRQHHVRRSIRIRRHRGLTVGSKVCHLRGKLSQKILKRYPDFGCDEGVIFCTPQLALREPPHLKPVD